MTDWRASSQKGPTNEPIESCVDPDSSLTDDQELMNVLIVFFLLFTLSILGIQD